MTDLLLVLGLVGFLALGTMAPFICSLGYVWVDTFYPHFLSYGLLSTVPVSFIMGAAAFGSYLLLDRRSPPRFSLLLTLYFLLAVWITLTTTWAVMPGPAFGKYDSAVKALLFAAFMPFVFRTRVQIEAVIMVMMFAAAAHILPWGFKTAVSGGGYEKSLGLLSSNAVALAESSTLAGACFAFIPILLVLIRHSVLLPPSRYTKIMFYGMCGFYAIGAVGTYARTALVGLVVMAAGLWWRAKHKVGFAIIGVVLLAVLFSFTSDKWADRVSTVTEYQTESSAAVRILVWRWTWDFALQNPLGGGFNVYLINRLELPNPDPTQPPIIHVGRAFHSIYFAVLGEHGFPGLAIYLTIQMLTFLGLHAARKRLRGHPDHAWCYEMAGAMQISLATLLACSNFVDVSFNPLVWNMLGFSLCLGEYARRAVPAVRRAPGQAQGQPVGGLASAAPSRA